MDGITQVYWPNVLMAVLLLIDDVCVFLSLGISLKVCCVVFRSKGITMRQLGCMIMGTYPVMVILFLCAWNFSTFMRYLAAPIRMLLIF